MIELSLISKNNVWKLEDREVFYLYSYFLNFFSKNKIDIFKNGIIEKKNLILFKEVVEKALFDLIENTYSKPIEKDIMKHPTRFERFVFNNNKYIVNYTSSVIGRLIYLIYLRYEFLDKTIKENDSIIISITKADDCFW